MSTANLKALADVGFNGDMQLGLIANSLLNVVGTTGATRRAALVAVAHDVEQLSVADIKKRKKSIQKPDTTKVDSGSEKGSTKLKTSGQKKTATPGKVS